MLRIVLLQCAVGVARTFSQGENCDSLPLLVESIAEKDNASLAAECRRHLGLRDCEQLLLSVGKGPWDTEVRQKACKKIADLLQSRTLLDTPLDKVVATKSPEPTEEPATLATVSPDALATLAPVELPTVAPVELATVAPPEVELVTVAPVEVPSLAPLPAVLLPTVAPAAASAEGEEAEDAEASQAQATPGLLNALGQTFVSPAAELTPEERKGQEDEDRPSWLSPSADLQNPLDAVDAALQPILTTAAPLRPVAEALRGAANGLLKGLAESEQTQTGEADVSKQSDQEHPSWKKEESFHERETDEAKGPFGVDLGDFISSNANQDPSQRDSSPEVETEGSSDEDWMEDKFKLRRKVVDSGTHKMLLWAFLFVALVSFASSLVIRWRPTAPTAYSRLEAQVPFSSSRQVRVA